MKEVRIYQAQDKSLQCGVCHHRCNIAEGKRGICGVRENQGGKLYSLNYGKTIAAHIDPIEKKPLYHYLSGTYIYSFAAVGCNFRCSWCQNWEISQQAANQPIAGLNISPEIHVKRAIDSNVPSIAYTYTEPTIFVEYALDTMKLAREKGLKNVWVTNGYMSRETLDLITPWLDAANVDFKGPQSGVYEKYCGGKAEPIMENLKYLYQAGVHLEITTLVVPGVNDQEAQLEEIAVFIADELSPNVPWHISRFFPGWKMSDTSSTPLKTMKMAEKVGKKAGLKYVYLGNI